MTISSSFWMGLSAWGRAVIAITGGSTLWLCPHSLCWEVEQSGLIGTSCGWEASLSDSKVTGWEEQVFFRLRLLEPDREQPISFSKGLAC